MDERQHAFQIAIDFIVPEPQDAKAFLGKVIIALRVAPGMRIEIVLAAIDLHNEALFKADEVNYITIARSLPTEVVSLFSP